MPQVADCCVAALLEDGAKNKVVEIIADTSAPASTWEDLFATIV